MSPWFKFLVNEIAVHFEVWEHMVIVSSCGIGGGEVSVLRSELLVNIIVNSLFVLVEARLEMMSTLVNLDLGVGDGGIEGIVI